MARKIDGGDEQPRPSLAFSESLGRTIKVIRTDLGVERRELAAQAGISYSYLTEIENGNKPPSSAVLAPIAAALGLRMSQLIDAAEARMERQSGVARPEGLYPAVREAAAVPGSIVSSPAVDQLWEAADPTPAASVRAVNLPSRAHSAWSEEKVSLRDARAAALELERLLRDMTAEDIERVLEYARWVAR